MCFDGDRKYFVSLLNYILFQGKLLQIKHSGGGGTGRGQPFKNYYPRETDK